MRRDFSFQQFTALTWYAFLFALFAAHIGPVVRVYCDKGGNAFTPAIKEAFPLRTRINALFVEMNGGVVRLLMQNRSNDTYKLSTVHLVRLSQSGDMMQKAKDEAALSSFCKERGMRFIFVLNPYWTGALSLIDSVPGDSLDANADAFLQHLGSMNVEYLDLRPVMKSCGSAVGNLYFRTDNHWNFDGFMAVYPFLAARLSTLAEGFEETSGTNGVVQAAMWNRVEFPRSFLGSYGRRTGRLFVRPERFCYYVPKFETAISVKTARHGVRHGCFTDAMLDYEVFMPPQSAFLDDAYSCYRQFRSAENSLAPLDKKICIIDDSYGRPEAAWLTTFYKKVWQIDLRRDDVSILENLEKSLPDVVAVLYNSSALSWPCARNKFGQSVDKDLLAKCAALFP